MLASFDGTDESRQNVEYNELRYRCGMNWDATPLAVRMDGEWQVWWKDNRAQTWFYRESLAQVVQIPFGVVP